MKILSAVPTSRVIRLLAVLALLPAGALAADAHTSLPFQGATANEETVTPSVRRAARHDADAARDVSAGEVASDESRMRPRDDAKVRGTSYAPVEYDDATMRPRDPKPNATQAEAVDEVDYDESRMRPRQ
jgi:hypothetical protein